MRVFSALLTLAICVAGALAGPGSEGAEIANVGRDIDFDGAVGVVERDFDEADLEMRDFDELEARAPPKKQKNTDRGPKKNLASRVSNLPPELRNQIGDTMAGSRAQALTQNIRTGPNSRHAQLMRDIRGQGPPKVWTDRDSPAYAVADRNRALRAFLDEYDLDARDFIDDFLEARNPPKKQKNTDRGPKKNLASRVSNLPPELRNQIGDHMAGSRAQALTQNIRTGPNSRHAQLMKDIRGQGPPKVWTDRTSAAHAVADRNRALRNFLEEYDLDARDFDNDYFEARNPPKKQKTTDRGPKKKLASRVSNLPPELRNQIGDHIAGSKAQTLTNQIRTGPNSRHAQLMRDVRGEGAPKVWTDRTSAAHGVADRNRGRSLEDLLEDFE